jgi:hypothetical protein
MQTQLEFQYFASLVQTETFGWDDDHSRSEEKTNCSQKEKESKKKE